MSQSRMRDGATGTGRRGDGETRGREMGDGEMGDGETRGRGDFGRLMLFVVRDRFDSILFRLSSRSPIPPLPVPASASPRRRVAASPIISLRRLVSPSPRPRVSIQSPPEHPQR